MKNKSMTGKIISLTIPNVITNITVPLLGIVDLAIVGHIGDGAFIGAIGIGTAIFNLIYWNFGFLRMGTTGMTAQAYGARNISEAAAVFLRSISVAVSIALCLILLQYPLFISSEYFMNISDAINPIVRDYFFVRIWAAPATLSLYAFKGWFIGMQNSRIPMMIAIVLNIVNIACSYLFAYHMNMGIKGVALGTVVAQYSGVIMSLFFILRYYRKIFRTLNPRVWMQLSEMKKFFSINKDIFLRTLCLVIIFTFFTSASAKINDATLAANTILMQLFTIFSYIMDGYAYSAESLAGRYYGARNRMLLLKCVRQVNIFGIVSAVAFTFTYIFCLRPILASFTTDSSVIDHAMTYRWWVAAIPLTGYLAFIYDGISGGMTKTIIMRNTIFAASALFFACYYTLHTTWGNNALWLSLILFLLARGIFQALAINKLIHNI